MDQWGPAGVGRRWAIAITVVVLSAVAALPAGASAVGRQAHLQHAGQDAAKPYYDSRVGARRAATRAGSIGSRAERSARTQLRRSLGTQAAVQVDALTGTARNVQRLDGALTAPAAGDRAAIAMRWVESNRTALGLSSADLDTLRLSERSVDKGSGFTFLLYRQFFRGIPTFDGGLRVNLDRGGRILNVTGAPIPDLSVPSVDPALSGSDALRALQANVDVRRAIDVKSGPDGVRQVTRFARGDFARLVLFDGPDGTRLAWHVLYRATSLALYDAVVDATTGKVLFRQNLTKFDDAEQSVFPNYPGAERDPNVPKATANAKITVSFEPTWLGDTTTTLNGPFAHVYTDRNDNNAVDGGEDITRAVGGAGDFVDTFTNTFQKPGTNACDWLNPAQPAPSWPSALGPTADCTWDPGTPGTRATNREDAGVQAFYFVNEFHDHLKTAPIGFTDDTDGFGPDPDPTVADDPVEVNAGDGMDTGSGANIPDADHVNNANMSTPPDGEQPLMQMYLFRFNPAADFTFRNVDGDFDAGTVWHEYTHGLSNRLVTHDDGSGATASPHTGAMGEAWSDWYALDLLHRRGLEIDDPADIDVDIGMYTDAVFTSTRFEPIDCRPVVDDANPRCPGGIGGSDTGGYTFADFGKVFVGPEVHSDGEIWMQTLWDLRRALIDDIGDEDLGSDAAEQLVTSAMRLSAPEPSFLDMRNAILAADAGLPLADQHRDLIWDVFADRGMGFFAGVADSSDTTPAEDFNTPPDPAAPKGRVAGTVTSADTGLTLSSVSIGFGGLTTNPMFPDYVAPTTSAANGAYSLQAPAGTYGGLVFERPGWDRVTARSVQIPGGGTRALNVALRRDWASARGGGSVTGSDDTGADFGCGVDELIDQSLGVGWSPFNPTSLDPENPHAGSPTAVIELPATIDITAFGMDPGNTCGDDPTSTTKDYTVETSADGVNFKPAKAGAFTPADGGRLNIVTPTANATGVRFVRLTLLTPQGAAPGDSGRDFIDFSEFEVFGGPRNRLPSGSLHANATTVNPGQTVQFIASFSDPDSKITGYRWDFDGNGTIEKTTTTPTASFAYPRGGDFTARVSATDFRGGAGTATQAIHVTTGPIALTPPKTGSNGRLRFRVSCELSCTATAKLTITKKLAKQLGLKKKRTVGSLRRSLAAGTSTRLTIKLTKKAKRALKRHGRKSVKATVTVTVRYADGRRDTAKRKVTIRL